MGTEPLAADERNASSADAVGVSRVRRFSEWKRLNSDRFSERECALQTLLDRDSSSNSGGKIRQRTTRCPWLKSRILGRKPLCYDGT